MTPVFMHIRPLIDDVESHHDITVTMTFLDDNNAVTCYNNATALIVGLSATKMPNNLSNGVINQIGKILENVVVHDSETDYRMRDLVRTIDALKWAQSKGDTFNKKMGCELEFKPLRFTLEQCKTKAVEIHDGDIVDFTDIEFKSMTTNDLCDMIIAAKTFGDLPSKAFRALVYTEIADYAYKHLSMFKHKKYKPYYMLPDFVL